MHWWCHCPMSSYARFLLQWASISRDILYSVTLCAWRNTLSLGNPLARSRQAHGSSSLPPWRLTDTDVSCVAPIDVEAPSRLRRRTPCRPCGCGCRWSCCCCCRLVRTPCGCRCCPGGTTDSARWPPRPSTAASSAACCAPFSSRLSGRLLLQLRRRLPAHPRPADLPPGLAELRYRLLQTAEGEAGLERLQDALPRAARRRPAGLDPLGDGERVREDAAG